MAGRFYVVIKAKYSLELSKLATPTRLIGIRAGGPQDMQYLLLIYGEEARWNEIEQKERDAVLEEYMSFTKSIAQSGYYRGGNELHRTLRAKTVRLRNGKRVVTDGPFAETKEALGGYYLIEAGDIDEAVEIAARIPSVRWGSVEIRPIIPHGAFGQRTV